MSMSCVLLFTLYEMCFSFYFGQIKYTLCNYDLDGVYEIVKPTCCWKPVSDSLKWNEIEDFHLWIIYAKDEE